MNVRTLKIQVRLGPSGEICDHGQNLDLNPLLWHCIVHMIASFNAKNLLYP